ncbi:MAG: radical SAM protein [Archaeoglobi archaeon]|nr:radical SAM protein [Candidatus Mnemosynella bozhongmuii]
MNLEVLQIEVTSRCNFNCSYCLRQFWDDSPRDMDMQTFRNVLEEFQSERCALYGFGEPLVHEEIEEMVKLASKFSEVLLVTNGSLDVQKVLKHVDFLGISLDSADPEFLKSVRRNAEFERISENIKRAMKETEVELEAVIMRENLDELESFVKWAGELGVDVSFSNLVPYSREMYGSVAFVELSKKPLEIYREMIGEYPKKERFLLDIALGKRDAVELYNRIWERVREEGYSINLHRILLEEGRIKLAERAERILERCREISEEYGIQLKVPKVFGEERGRECPYSDGIFVRADGRIAPCMELAYTHSEYLNNHEKRVTSYFLDSKIVEDEFQKRKKLLNELTPWCGNCPYASFCWYVEESRDCYANKPSCSECLYSAGISRCIL